MRGDVCSWDVLSELSPIGVRVGAEPLCPHGLPCNGCVALLEAALFRIVGPHPGLTFEGCSLSSSQQVRQYIVPHP